MADNSAIEWTDATWTPIRGTGINHWFCQKVSPGCDHCYASRLNVRFGGQAFLEPDHKYVMAEAVAKGTIQLNAKALTIPLHWRRPRKVFVCSQTDLFGEWVPDEWLDAVFAVMAGAPQHTFQVLTKRAKRMREYFATPDRERAISAHVCRQQMTARCPAFGCAEDCEMDGFEWPLPNVWLGVSVESQAYAWRLNYLAQTPAAVRFVSVEPLLGPVDLRGIATFPDWVIVGGESGGPVARRLLGEPCPHCIGGWVHRTDVDGRELRPVECPTCGGCGNRSERINWVRDLRDQCLERSAAFLFKQFGGPTPKSGGRMLDGQTWDQYPVVRA